jgi:hypothetical protein
MSKRRPNAHLLSALLSAGASSLLGEGVLPFPLPLFAQASDGSDGRIGRKRARERCEPAVSGRDQVYGEERIVDVVKSEEAKRV